MHNRNSLGDKLKLLREKLKESISIAQGNINILDPNIKKNNFKSAKAYKYRPNWLRIYHKKSNIKILYSNKIVRRCYFNINK